MIMDLNTFSAAELSELSIDLNKILPFKVESDCSNQESLEKQRKYECPYCHSNHIVKNGHTKKGVQKYICRDCKKHFYPTSQSVLCRARKPYHVYEKFIEMESQFSTLKNEAVQLDISVTTAFHWRQKFHEALKKDKENIHFKGITEIDACYKPINLKGMKNKDMPRSSHHRKRKGHRGLTNHEICILTAVDENDQAIIKAYKLGKESVDDYRHLLKNADDITILVSDGIQGIEELGKELNAKTEIVKAEAHVSTNGYSLGNINQLHSDISFMISKYKGISLRHMQGYLDALWFFKSLKYKVDQRYIGPEGYLQSYPKYEAITNCLIYKKEIPFDLSKTYPYHQGFLKNA